ncbi:MAG: methyltransferase domain-containing protein [Candidatus Eiseniibacteriota bacterium]
MTRTSSTPGGTPTSRSPGAQRTPVSPAAQARTLGPVSDLERHLPPDWWKSLFNALYLQTDGDVVENEANTKREIDLVIKCAGLEPGDRVLDLCCGQGRHSLELARRGFSRVTGIDRSRYLIRLARKRARQDGLVASFHEGDARRFRVAESSFDCVTLLGNSFGYFESEQDDLAVLEAVKRALRSNGKLVMDLADGDWMRGHFEKRSWEWIDQNQFVCRERSLSEDRERLLTREVVVHAEKGVLADQFYAERLYSADKINKLLERAGFTGVRVHETVEAESGRNQDLGMMARRIFLTAQGPHKAPVAKGRRVPYPTVTVIMGDPRLPDTVKLEGKFNDEDFATIKKLQDALGQLDGYTFEYRDNHAALLSDLRARPPQFVLNLCDEGYNNDAFMELHVPALLEMLGVPYTGAGPVALGLCYNKALVNAIAGTLGVPVPAETYFDPADQSATIPTILPALIKPTFGDSSVGITSKAVVHTTQEAVDYIGSLRETLPGRPLVVQEYLSGAEFSVGLIGNPGVGLTALPVLEVDYSHLDPNLPPILSWESKWDPESPYWTQIRYREAVLDDDARRKLVDYSLILFERLGCRDYARFDFRADSKGVIKLLEVNPNPGWCWDGKLNLMAGFGGMSYADMLRMIIDAAQARSVASIAEAARVAAE